VRVLVTGATGFVASHLCPALARDGHEVLALGHDRSRLPIGDGIEPVEHDLVQATAFPEAEAIVHLAQANVRFPDGARDLFAVNTASTAALLDHARRTGAEHFVLASSASVYGFGDAPFPEDAPAQASDFYSATKIAAERLVTAYESLLRTTILRLVAPYGPGQRGRLIPSLVARVRAGQPITLNDGGRPRLNPIYVDDVVSVVVAALAGVAAGTLNVAGDERVSIRDLGDAIGGTLGVEALYEEQSGGTAGDLIADNARLRALLGARLVPLREGLRRTILAEAHA
jgi:nucleoside-diphosphate-sugar epimerase